MSRQNVSSLLQASALLLVVLAAATLLPNGGSRMISDMGYHSLCPFAPYSTGSLLLLAGLARVIEKHVKQLKD